MSVKIVSNQVPNLSFRVLQIVSTVIIIGEVSRQFLHAYSTSFSAENSTKILGVLIDLEAVLSGCLAAIVPLLIAALTYTILDQKKALFIAKFFVLPILVLLSIYMMSARQSTQNYKSSRANKLIDIVTKNAENSIKIANDERYINQTKTQDRRSKDTQQMLDTVKQFGLSGSDKLNKSLERTLGISDFSNFITILFNAIIVFLGAICGAITKERDPEFIKKEAEELAAIRVAKAYQRGIRTQVIRADDRQVKKKIEEISKKTEIPIATKIPQILTPESKKQREEVKKKSSDQIIQ